ncbi:hypothetical protein HMI55_004888 [Coelomomyces lativittatus]|nr:hypothetical protein HMI55_004888 [Coelomomyces lativittatus]
MLERQSLLEQDLHELKLRFELLEGDKKAYFEQSQLTINLNKDEIARCKLQGKELRNALAKMKKSWNFDRGGPSDRLQITELEKLDQRMIELHKKSDIMQATIRCKEQKLKELHDRLRDLEQEAALVKADTEHSTLARDIRHLENQLDKAIIKYNEAQSMRKTYEEIVARLQEERQTFDAQLAHFDQTVKAKKEDSEELELLSGDAHHAKELARSELVRIEQQINEDRKAREKDLMSRRELVRQKLESSERLELQLIVSSDTARAMDKSSTHLAESDQLQEKVTEYEELIKHIKEATGADELTQVVAKFEEQRDTKARLTDLAKKNEVKLNQLRAQRLTLLKELDEVLVKGESVETISKDHIQEVNNAFEEELLKYKDVCEKNQRLTTMLSNVKSGVCHLWDKLKEDKTQKSVITDATLVDCLNQCFSKVSQLLQVINGKDIMIEGDLNTIPVHVSSQNTRVRMAPVSFESEESESEGSGSGDDAEDNVVPDRESIKKAAMSLINARTKAKSGKRKKKKDKSAAADDDDDPSD